MSINLSEEMKNAEDFHVKLRYFNEMISEMQSVLLLDPADVKITQDAEREVSAQMVRYRSAADSVAQARAALEVTEKMLARVKTELQLATKQAHDLAEATIRGVEARPQVRDAYKSGLRDIFSGSKTGITAVGAADLDKYAPDHVQIGSEAGFTVLRWQWQGAGAQSLRFEAAFAVGDGDFVSRYTPHEHGRKVHPYRHYRTRRGNAPDVFLGCAWQSTYHRWHTDYLPRSRFNAGRRGRTME